MIQQRYRQGVIAVALAICLFYLSYRLLFTLNLTTPYALSVSLFLYIGEFYGVFVLVLFFLQVWDSREPPQQPILEDRSVDVFVPTYNEDPQLLRATLEACNRLEYPHKTYVCDDGKRPAVEALAKELGIHYMIRPDNRHAKAGNLNHAFEKTDGEFIIILDADHVPEPNFISRLIGYFHDEKLGFVQTPHAFYNFDSFQARLDHKNRRYWEEGHLFYEVIQPGRNRWGCPIFAGSAAMFRRKALEEVGYIAVETITEDMHTGMRVNARGWKSLAISERLVAGQAAPDVTTFHSQRIRWGEGNLSIMAYDNPLTMRGLGLAQRFCYLGSMVHWAGGLFKLAIYLTPILMMFSGVAPVAEFTWALAFITLTYLIASVYGVRVASNGFGSFFNGELFCMVNFWTQIRGTMRAIFWRKFQKFVVTSKRGRQAKTIWPYVRPQIVLMGVSVVALVWGWSRVLLNISDDYFKPIIPSFWILFHMSLAYVVLRRALWPEDRRFSTRHIVNLPVAYQSRGVDTGGTAIDGGPERRSRELRGSGVTVDLNETGVGLVAYERLAIHELLRLTLWGAGESVECEGEIRWMKELTARAKNGPNPSRGFRYGIAFRNLSPEQMDVLNRMTLHYAVPRMYAEYAQNRERTLWRRVCGRVAQGIIQRRVAFRHQVRLPLVLNPDEVQGPAMHLVTEDVSRTALSALLSTPLPAGKEVDFLLPTPLGDVRGRARVLRGEPRRYAAREYQLSILQFIHFDGQGRVTLEMVINPRESLHLEPVLNPDKETLPVPMARPVLVGLAAAVPLVLAEMGCFHFIYRNDLFLRDIAVASRPVSEEDLARLEGIFTDTMQESYPSNDRLVLLMGALARVNRPGEIDQVTVLLAPRDRRNLDLQFALAQILDNSQDYEKAEAEYQRLLSEIERGNLPASRKRDLLLGAARASVHAGNLDRAGELFRTLLRTYPQDATLRNEFAGVLMSAHRLQEAVQLYQGVEPDLNGRLLLVAIHAQANDLDAAEKECRRIAAQRPDDPQAKLLLADVLSWKKGGYRQSRAIYEQLLKANAGSPDLLVRLAQISLWGNHYDEALERFQSLVDERLDNAEVVKGYVDAAASAERLNETQHRTAVAIYEHTLTGPADDPIFLARLAWVLQRVKEVDKSAVLLDRVMALNPQDPSVRKQLLGSFLAAGRLTDGLKEFEGKDLDFDTRQLLVSLHVRNHDFAAGVTECRHLLELKPGDPKTRRLLADILSWNKEYQESLALLRELAEAAPNDPELPVRLAEVTLWSGDYDQALARFQALLEAKFDRPELWSSYVAAASSAKSLAESHRRMVLRIIEQAALEAPQDSLFFGRLAWVLHRLKEDEKAGPLLDRAVASPPQDPAARRELAGVLAAAGRSKAALQLYEGLTLDLEDRCRLAALYAADKNFAAAEEQCRAILREKPGDKRVARQLADVLSWKKDYAEALALFEKLARDDPKDAELPLRLAEVTLWSGDHDKALARFQALLVANFDQPKLWLGYVNAAAGAQKLDARQAELAARIAEQALACESKDVALLTRLAWVLHRLKDTAKAGPLLDRALALPPQEPAARKELAGVLAAAGKTKAALGLYEGLPLEREDRHRLAALYAADHDFTAAEQQCRIILRDQPQDPQARRRLADVLSWKKDYAEALTLFEKLAQDDPKDAELPLRLAEVTLWSGDHDKALFRFQALLEANFDQPELWPSYVNAAAGAHKLDARQVDLAAQIGEKALAEESKDVALLTRLAWVLHRLKADAKAGSLLDRAVALQPPDPAIRKELAGVLAAVGKIKSALRLYEGLPLELEDRYRVAALYLADNDFAAAEQQCRALLHSRPDDKQALRLLAAVLSGKKEYPEALTLLQKLSDADPADTELSVRLAETTLWSGDYDKAISRFQSLLEAKFDQPELWRSFVDAAASAPGLSENQAGLALRIYERTVAAESKDVAFLARLAWLLYRAKESAKAGTLLDQALALHPKEPAVRKELAGTLASIGRFKDALQMYEGIPLDLDDRYHLVGIYATALLKYRDILQDEPDDKDAQRLSTYVSSWKPTVQESVALMEKQAREAPRDHRLLVRLAEVTLWSGNYEQALCRFQALLEEEFDQPPLWRCYVDAAASTEMLLTEAHARMLLRICERRARVETKVEYISRLAWVLFRLKELPKVEQLLDRAVALRPTEPAVRKELAGVLAAAGRPQQAREMYEGLKLTFADHYRLAEIDIAAGEFAAAEKEVQAILRARPEDLRAQLLLAAILSGDKKYGEAAKLYEKLLADHPRDRTIPVKLAEMALWSGDYDTALVHYQRLLDKDLQRQALWRGYIDAAASAKTLPETAHEVVVHICETTRLAKPKEPVFLARLAWVLRRVKEPQKSTALLQQALDLEPGSRGLRLQLAEALYEAGAYEEAEKHYQVLLRPSQTSPK
jgi:tetratricopeptide (TPR) repeat protein/cellulose synthase/poly-beta-1,6-N-acetylglucosamine synthase-like glycosyltransferase